MTSLTPAAAGYTPRCTALVIPVPVILPVIVHPLLTWKRLPAALVNFVELTFFAQTLAGTVTASCFSAMPRKSTTFAPELSAACT